MTRFSLARPAHRLAAVRERRHDARDPWPDSAPWHRGYHVSSSLGPLRDLGALRAESVLAVQATLAATAAVGSERAMDLRIAARGLVRNASDPVLRRECVSVLWRARRAGTPRGVIALCSALGALATLCGPGGAAAVQRLRFEHAGRHRLAPIHHDAAVRLARAAEAAGDRTAAITWHSRALG